MSNAIQLELTLPEVNQILAALGELPFKQVFDLVQKIQSQAGAQLETSRETST